MKLVKSLLLGAASALAFGGVASAADLPAAEPVEYVRVCDAYGAGFFYIPGTDTCLRVSGFVRVQAFYHSENANVTNYTGFGGNLLSPSFRAVAGVGTPTHVGVVTGLAAPVATGVGFATSASTAAIVFPGVGFATYNDPYRDQLDLGIRALMRFDARSRTEWGVLRSFFEFAADSATNAINGTGLVVRYGFVQFGPITAGITDSFFNFDNGVYYGDVVGDRTSRVVTFAYTAAFGNGISATVALEDATVPIGAGQAGIGGTTSGLLYTAGAANLGSRLPDLVGNIRIAQAWGTAQLSGVVGQRRFRDDACLFPGAVAPSICSWDDTAWAIKGGLRVNLPFLATGSHIQVQGTYGEGASNFTFLGGGPYGIANYFQSSFVPSGAAIVDERTINRIDSWSVFANFVHFFTPALRATVYGGYGKLEYNGSAAQLPGNGAVLLDYTWQIGGGLQWTPVRNLDLGLEVFYTDNRYRVANGNPALGPIGYIARTNDDGWGGIFRIQRSF